jgi:hypothetical protein
MTKGFLRKLSLMAGGKSHLAKGSTTPDFHVILSYRKEGHPTSDESSVATFELPIAPRL